MSVCVGVNASASAISEKEATRPQAVVVGIGTDDAAIQVHGEGAATQKMVVSRVSPLASTLQLQQIKLKLQGCAPHPSDPTTKIGHSTGLLIQQYILLALSRPPCTVAVCHTFIQPHTV